MKNIFVFLLTLFLASTANAQQSTKLCTPITTGGVTNCTAVTAANPLPISVFDSGNHSGYCYTSNGSGTAASFQVCGGGGGSPGGTSGQIQYNNAGAFGGFTASGDLTIVPSTGAVTLATVNSNTGSFGSSTAIPVITLNGKGLATAASTAVVIAPAGTLSGTTLNSTVVSSSLTSVGTIATGVWNGTIVTGTYGGTGVNNGSFQLTVPATGTADLLGTAQSITAAKTFTNSDILMLGSSTGATTLTSANAGASNFTLTLPAVTSTFATLAAQTFAALQTFSSSIYLSSGYFETADATANTGTSYAINIDNGPQQVLTVTGAVAITLTTPTHGGSSRVFIKQDATGHVYSITGCKWAGGTAITYSTAANALDEVSVAYSPSLSTFICMGGAAFN